MIRNVMLLVFLSPLYALGYVQQSCNYTLSGKVVDETGNALIGASILLSGKTGVVSDEHGNFSLIGLCKDTYALTIQYVGFKTLNVDIIMQENTARIFAMEPERTKLDEVTVQGELQHTDHAHNYSVMGEKELSELAGKSLGETVQEIPGVTTIQSGPGTFKPVIHGVHSQRILILNHGIRQEGQQWGADHAPEIDPFVASDIVVIKDASAIKYGTDAIGGVIIVNPAPLPEQPGLGATMNAVLQSNGRSGTVSGMVEGGIHGLDGWGWRTQGTLKRAGDFQTPDYNLTNTGIKEANFSAAAGYHGDHSGIEVFFSHFQTEVGILKGTSIGSLDDLIVAMEREPPQYTTGFSYDILEPRQTVKHNLLKVNGHLQRGASEWRFQYGFQTDRRKEFDIRRGGLSNIPAIDLQLQSHSVETEWETSHSKHVSTCIGVTGMFQQNRNIPGTQRIPFIPNFNHISAGLFGITRITLPSWVVDLGLRYDFRYYDVSGYDFKNALYTSSLQFNNVSATAGASKEIDSRQSLHINLSTTWRPPHVAELYSVGTHQSAAAIEYGLLLNDSTNEVLDIDDVSFQNEKALKWVGTYRRESDRVDVEASAFANYIFNYIYLRPTGVTETVRGVYPYFRYTQTDALFVGLDLSAVWTPHAHVKVTSRASLISASDRTNSDYLVFIPSNRYETGIRYERPYKSVNTFYVESKVSYSARQTRAPRVVTPRQIVEASEQGQDPFKDHSNFDFMEAPDGFFLWNLTTGFSTRSETVRYDIRLTAENVLNTSYRMYTNRFRYYADDIGRNFILSFKCAF